MNKGNEILQIFQKSLDIFWHIPFFHTLGSSHSVIAIYLDFNDCCNQVRQALPIQPFSSSYQPVANLPWFSCSCYSQGVHRVVQSNCEVVPLDWSCSWLETALQCYSLRAMALTDTGYKIIIYCHKHLEDFVLIKPFKFFLTYWNIMW